jgi:hypothetical protein
MNHIALRNNNFAASTLFTYKMDSEAESNSYIQSINQISREFSDDVSGKGMLYVEKIFGYLGDKSNQYITGLRDETVGYWFAYDLDLDKNDWDSFKADSLSDYTPDESDRTISALNRELRKGYEGALVVWNKKYNGTLTIIFSSVFRTRAHQNRLFKDGKTSVSGIGKHISKHNYYLSDAFDFNILDANGKYLDGINLKKYRVLYEEFYIYVKNIVPDAIWGGGFHNDKNDVVHIQINNPKKKIS